MALLRRIGTRMLHGFEISGYTRAAVQLRSQGYHDYADNCIRMANKLKGEQHVKID